MVKFDLLKALQERILILDGAMGTMIQRYNLTEKDYRGERFVDHPVDLKGNNDILSLTCPQVLKDIHLQYLRAGADIIETCTFGSQRLTQSEYATQEFCRELNIAASINARRAVEEFLATPEGSGRQAWVAGSIGPTGKTLSMSPDVNDASKRSVTFEEMAAAYLEQILALQEGGVDLFLLETIFDALNAKAAIWALDEAAAITGVRLPLAISVTLADRSGRTLCGQTLEAFWASICHAKPVTVGINCALGAEEMAPHLERLASLVTCGISCYPNAGLPNAEGGYDETPEHMAKVLQGYAQKGWLNIVGGCCGTSPDYIKAIAESMSGVAPRKVCKIEKRALLSGLELYDFAGNATGFTVIGERCNLSGSAKFARLIRAKDFEGALAVARQQVENGANVIDINLDDAMHNSVEVMEHFLRLLVAEPEIAKVPFMLDSSHWEVLEAGLKCVPGRSLVNSISLKEGEDSFKKKAAVIRRLGGLPVIMCFDEKGQGDTLARKIEIVNRACHILIDELHFEPQEIVLDLAVLSVATGIESHSTYGRDFIEAVSYVNSHWPKVMTNGGISNVSFALRGNNPVREAMHSVFLYHATRAGLTMGIVNAGLLRVYEEIPSELRQGVEDVLLDSDPKATERLLEIAERHRADGSASSVGAEQRWRSLDVRGRLATSLVKGITEYLEVDIKEAIEAGFTPLEIVEKALMGGMHQVGELFGSGRMFLPQVVKSARVMKKAVALLETYMASDKGEARETILLATVKGDVHDIGKNIVSVVLGCNGYKVIDLGVMVPEEDIVSKAMESKAKIIGLSALITPSLAEIVNVVKALERRGLQVPVLVGGAATSATHTAVKVAPHYSNGSVVYVPDASVVTEVVGNILDPLRSEVYLQTLREQQLKLQDSWCKEEELLSWEEAKKRAPNFTWLPGELREPAGALQKSEVIDIPLQEVLPYINWTQFLNSWKIAGTYPKVFDDLEWGAKAYKVYSDGRSILDYICKSNSLQIRAVYGFWPAYSLHEDIYLHDAGKILAKIPTLRQQKKGLEICLSLADFIAPKGTEKKDYLGMFALSSGFGLGKLRQLYEEQDDDYSSLMVSLLADRLCEAASEYLHKKIRALCGWPDREGLAIEELFKCHYKGIRPAPGYPACPDHYLKKIIWQFLQPEDNIGLELTESTALRPASSISGLYFASPKARYFSLGKIDRQQLLDYHQRWGRAPEDLQETEKWLSLNLN